jgi:hypothetical protein
MGWIEGAGKVRRDSEEVLGQSPCRLWSVERR